MHKPYLERKAAEFRPAHWLGASAKSKPGKRQKAILRHTRSRLAMQDARSQGMRCGNCRSYRAENGRAWCERHSDAGGYVVAKADGICAQHREAV